MKKYNNLKCLVDNGYTVADISKEFGVSLQYVYKLIKNGKIVCITKQKRKKILAMIERGLSNKEIAKKLSVKSLIINNIRKKLIESHKTENRLTQWSEKMFADIGSISKKYYKKISMKGIEIDVGDIESVLLDLMIHTDQKDIENKDAYFRKYCPFKIKNLISKTIANFHMGLVDLETGEEIFSTCTDPEKILMAFEEYRSNF